MNLEAIGEKKKHALSDATNKGIGNKDEHTTKGWVNPSFYKQRRLNDDAKKVKSEQKRAFFSGDKVQQHNIKSTIVTTETTEGSDDSGKQ